MTPTAAFNPQRKFVRIIDTHANGLIAFEFAVGEPGLFVEMLMGRQQFEDFCALHRVSPTHGPLEDETDPGAHEWDWSLHAARTQKNRHGDPA